MVRFVGLTLGLLLEAGATVLVGGQPAANMKISPAHQPAPANLPESSWGSTRDRLYLTPAERREAGQSSLWAVDVRSLLNIPSPMRHGGFVWNEDGVPPGALFVRVDLRTQLISVFRGGHEIGTAIILYGADSHRTPEGTFPILAKLRDHTSRTYDAPMPYTLRLTGDGVAIHGSAVRADAASHGCIGVPVEFARRLFDAAKIADEVLIIRSPAPATRPSARPA